jgi:transposase
MLLSEGQMSDFKGAALLIEAFPKATFLLGDKGYDADWFRHALADRGITACIPSKANRKVPIPHDKLLCRRRHKIENNVRQTQGLAAHPHSLRPMLPHVHVRHLHRSHHHLLALINES